MIFIGIFLHELCTRGREHDHFIVVNQIDERTFTSWSRPTNCTRTSNQFGIVLVIIITSITYGPLCFHGCTHRRLCRSDFKQY